MSNNAHRHRHTAKPAKRLRQIAKAKKIGKAFVRALRELGWHERAERVEWEIADIAKDMELR